MTPFGLALSSYRRRQGLLQKQIALSLGVSLALVCSWERALKPPPKGDQLDRLSDLLSLTSVERGEIAVLAAESAPSVRVRAGTSAEGYRLMHRLAARLPDMPANQVSALASVLALNEEVTMSG